MNLFLHCIIMAANQYCILTVSIECHLLTYNFFLKSPPKEDEEIKKISDE